MHFLPSTRSVTFTGIVGSVLWRRNVSRSPASELGPQSVTPSGSLRGEVCHWGRDLKPKPHSTSSLLSVLLLVPEDVRAQLPAPAVLPSPALRLTAGLATQELSAQINSSFYAVLTVVCYHSNRSNWQSVGARGSCSQWITQYDSSHVDAWSRCHQYGQWNPLCDSLWSPCEMPSVMDGHKMSLQGYLVTLPWNLPCL